MDMCKIPFYSDQRAKREEALYRVYINANSLTLRASIEWEQISSSSFPIVVILPQTSLKAQKKRRALIRTRQRIYLFNPPPGLPERNRTERPLTSSFKNHSAIIQPMMTTARLVKDPFLRMTLLPIPISRVPVHIDQAGGWRITK